MPVLPRRTLQQYFAPGCLISQRSALGQRSLKYSGPANTHILGPQYPYICLQHECRPSLQWDETALHMPHILIVDEEPAITTLLSLAFARAGYDVTTASTGFKAVALLKSTAFDAVLSEVDMPLMDGHELVRWIVLNHPTIRCVLMSALGIDCDQCPFHGRCVMLRKPFVPKEAVALIAEILNKSPN
jgi:CheY-like chemotaxis protein